MPAILNTKGVCSGTGISYQSGVISRSLLQAQKDALAYRTLLASNGRTLQQADYQQIVSFATQLYAVVGRQDFLTLRTLQNMGAGTTAYTFHGKACNLTNGPTWGTSGLTMPVGVNAKINIPWSIPAAPAALFSVASGMVVSGNTAAPVWLGWGFNNGQRGWQSLTTAVMFATNGTRINLYGVTDTMDTRLFQIAQPSNSAASYTGYNGTTQIATNDGSPTWDTLSTTSTQVFGDAPSSYPIASVGAFLMCAALDLRTNYLSIRNAYKSTIGQGLSLP